MQDLSEIRHEIDGIDDEIVDLFQKRMTLADEIGAYKRENDLPVLDRARERAKLAEMASKVPEDLQDNVSVLFQLIMEASRTRQYELVNRDTDLLEAIERAQQETPHLFPQQAFVACQGVEGAFSQIAADKLFKRPSISYFDTFDGVFRAVEQGFCSSASCRWRTRRQAR
jgi:chorismate mutase/prephenate dehydratase